MTWGDLFCGGGGTTTGALSVPGVKVLWALNHSASAIATHMANHPETKHYQTDILMQDEHDMEPVDGIWMSSECTNHSIAKGGKLLDQGSRVLPMQLIRFVKHCMPKVIIVENVKEFVNWGHLKDGRPDKGRKGESYLQWVDAIKECGYPNYEYRLLNAADFGAYTSRLRYFGIFTAEGYTIRIPDKTHDKTGANGLPKWKPCKDKLNLADYGRSIFEKNLCPNTIKRIEAGLKKHGGDPFILSFYGSNGKPHDCSIKESLPTLTTKDRHALITQTIGDVFFRFISIQEAKELQGFPADYVLVGSKAEQLRHIGNSVVPLMAKVLIEANMIGLGKMDDMDDMDVMDRMDGISANAGMRRRDVASPMEVTG